MFGTGVLAAGLKKQAEKNQRKAAAALLAERKAAAIEAAEAKKLAEQREPPCQPEQPEQAEREPPEEPAGAEGAEAEEAEEPAERREQPPEPPQEPPERAEADRPPGSASSCPEEPARRTAPVEGSEKTVGQQGADSSMQGLAALSGTTLIKSIRALVRKSPNSFLDFMNGLGQSDPELLKHIQQNCEEFMDMILSDMGGEPEVDEAPATSSVVAKQPLSKKEALRKEYAKLNQALRPTTRSVHTLALRHSPFSCAVCKTTKDLTICSCCKMVRFCSREHQRAFWPKHKRFCNFIAACRGGLLAEVRGKPFVKEALPRILDVWKKEFREEPHVWETQQLLGIPRCRVCDKFPVATTCKKCLYTGWCSQECERADTAHGPSWQCISARLTAHASHLLHQFGNGAIFVTRRMDVPLSVETVTEGWQRYMKEADLDVQGKPFLKCNPIIQNIVVDALSFPISVLEALHSVKLPLEQLCEGREHLEVHVFGTGTTELSDPAKYEEWLHLGGAHLRSLTLHCVRGDGEIYDSTCDFSSHLCEACRKRGRSFTMRAHSCGPERFLQEEAPKLPRPAFRVAYSPVSGMSPLTIRGARPKILGDAAWNLLAAESPAVPFVMIDSSLAELKCNCRQARRAGLARLGGPVMGRFASPLVLYDEDLPPASHPGKLGVVVPNSNWATFGEKAARDSDSDASSSMDEEVTSSSEYESEDEDEDEDEEEEERARKAEKAPTGKAEDLRAKIAADLRACKDATAAAASSGPWPSESEARGNTTSIPGPWSFRDSNSEDFPYSAAHNPEGTFSVELDVRCTGGSGYRSPLTCRDASPASGYVFYVDPDERWAFWVGDGSRWKGVRGPAVVMGEWTRLKGVVEPSERRIRFYVDGGSVAQRTDVDFVPNRRMPLRLGAGRSEQSPLFHLTGEVRNVRITDFNVQDAVDGQGAAASSSRSSAP